MFGFVSKGIRSAGSAVSGQVSSVRKHATGLANPRAFLDPRRAAKNAREQSKLIAPTAILRTVDPRSLLSAARTGRLPGASTIPGASSLQPGFGLNLRDRVRVANGHPESIAKAVLGAAASSPSSRWAPRGMGRGMGPMVANLSNAAREGVVASSYTKVKVRSWF
jgi:hypothetical protein